MSVLAAAIVGFLGWVTLVAVMSHRLSELERRVDELERPATVEKGAGK